MTDIDGYPTQDELRFIDEWNYQKDTVQDMLDRIERAWWMPEWGFIEMGTRLELHTGGWSGNEEVIHHLRKSMFWMFYWESEQRGGHYVFEIPIGGKK